MDRKFQVEPKVADALLDVGISVPLKSIRIPFKKKPVQLRVTMKCPRMGTQIRITRLFLEMGVTYEEYTSYDTDQRLRFYAEHGKTISRMIAMTICFGKFSGQWFSRIVAWFLRWAVDYKYMEAAYAQFVSLLGTKSFEDIIRSAQATSPLIPTNLS